MGATRHFLTVCWCDKGPRGVFCARSGGAAVQDEPWTQAQAQEMLGPFALILGPETREMDEENLAQYNRFLPLAEYQGEYGIAVPAGGNDVDHNQS
ncbi:MAG TPA: hypothetical protein VNA25_05790 [Phycisphaerae bacterium]|nr:hypothetical protein [Phycisphaerae bacterium]